jgi:hypothetical protein
VDLDGESFIVHTWIRPIFRIKVVGERQACGRGVSRMNFDDSLSQFLSSH